MSKNGGSVAINGFLYQIIANLSRISEIHLSAQLDGNEMTSARLILEPKEGGGDARYENPNIRIIEQYKTRSNNRTWALREIIDDVLPDLFKAINPEKLNEPCQYRFVTDGRNGRFGYFVKFLQQFKDGKASDKPLTFLDNKHKYPFFKNDCYTDREFYLYLLENIKTYNDQRSDKQLVEQLSHFLSNFSIHDNKTSQDFVHYIEEFLFQVVDKREDVVHKRNELCGILVDLSAKGNVSSTPKEIFKKASLEAIPITDLEQLKINLKHCVKELFSSYEYQSLKDVRQKPEGFKNKPIYVLSGESGQGKTWQMFNLVEKMLESGESVVIVDASGDAEKDLQKACDTFWCAGLSHDNTINIRDLKERYKKTLKPAGNYWLTIFIDNLQNIKETNDLLKHPLALWGIRLVFTAPLIVGKLLASQYKKNVHVSEIKDFKTHELWDFFERQGCEWDEIPEDIRETLHKPILANLYGQTHSAKWKPHNEYELFDKYWHRVTESRTQVNYPGDRSLLLRLVGTLLKKKHKYPWPWALLNSVGIDNEVFRRLEAIGWLRRLTRDDVEICHDRFLNWAVAEYLIDQRRTDELSFHDFNKIINKMYDEKPTFCNKSLSYVPMDYLWLACDTSS